MAKISSFMICESITNLETPQGERIPQLLAPQSVLRPPYIPGSYSFGFSIGASGVSLEIVNTIIIKITSPSGKEAYDSGIINLGPFPEDKHIPLESSGFVISIDIRNLPITEEGVYSIEMTINGESVGKQRLPIYRKE